MSREQLRLIPRQSSEKGIGSLGGMIWGGFRSEFAVCCCLVKVSNDEHIWRP